MVPNQVSYAHICPSIVIYIFHETQKYYHHIYLFTFPGPPWPYMVIYCYLYFSRSGDCE